MLIDLLKTITYFKSPTVGYCEVLQVVCLSKVAQLPDFSSIDFKSVATNT